MIVRLCRGSLLCFHHSLCLRNNSKYPLKRTRQARKEEPRYHLAINVPKRPLIQVNESTPAVNFRDGISLSLPRRWNSRGGSISALLAARGLYLSRASLTVSRPYLLQPCAALRLFVARARRHTTTLSRWSGSFRSGIARPIERFHRRDSESLGLVTGECGMYRWEEAFRVMWFWCVEKSVFSREKGTSLYASDCMYPDWADPHLFRYCEPYIEICTSVSPRLWIT